MIAWVIGLCAFLVSVLATYLMVGIAKKLDIVDHPVGGRKVHKHPTPLMGGLGIFIALVVLVLIVVFGSDLLTQGSITSAHYVGILLAMSIVVLGGVLDDRYNLPPKWQLVFPVVAAIVAILGGLDIEKLTNPFGGYLYLDTARQQFGSLGSHPLVLSWPGDLLVFLWLMGMMYTTKFLDGLDGLATSIGSVGALMVLLLAGSAAFFQPDVIVLAAIVLGAFLGFLVWNVHPAKIFLGEGGALLVGFTLGILAVISGGKIATLLLVAGVPILDVVWVIGRRLRRGGSVAKGDRLHLHHRLLDMGLSQNRILLLYTGVALLFGALTLVLSSLAKLLALFFLVLCMIAAGYLLFSNEQITHD